MTRIRLQYIDHFRDRHGRQRFYFRRRGERRIPLPGLPGSREFSEAYQAALVGAVIPETAGPAKSGTIARLVEDYFKSPEYLTMAKSSQIAYRRVIDRWVADENIGHRPIAGMRREHVAKMIAKRAATPGAANDLLKKIKLLMTFAIRNGWRTDDPTLKMKTFASGEFHTWTEEEVQQFEAGHPIGSTARLAFALLLYTGQRRSDVVTMKWSDISEGLIRVVQRKTKTRIEIALHPALSAILADTIRRGPTILVTGPGKAFSSNGFGNWMARKIDEAGLPDRCVTHGLRKASARRLAEAGCSAKEIAAITGHLSLAEVEHYTRAAEQRRLALSAIGKLDSGSLTVSQTGIR